MPAPAPTTTPAPAPTVVEAKPKQDQPPPPPPQIQMPTWFSSPLTLEQVTALEALPPVEAVESISKTLVVSASVAEENPLKKEAIMSSYLEIYAFCRESNLKPLFSFISLGFVRWLVTNITKQPDVDHFLSEFRIFFTKTAEYIESCGQPATDLYTILNRFLATFVQQFEVIKFALSKK